MEHGAVVGKPGTCMITIEALLCLECDILIPGALRERLMLRHATAGRRTVWGDK